MSYKDNLEQIRKSVEDIVRDKGLSPDDICCILYKAGMDIKSLSKMIAEKTRYEPGTIESRIEARIASIARSDLDEPVERGETGPVARPHP